MSNYPKVYGFCDAGCKRQVTTYDEFKKSATFVSVPVTDGSCAVDGIGKYRIYSDYTLNIHNCSLFLLDGAWVQANNPIYTFSGIEADGYRGYFDFELLAVTSNGFGLTIVYEINGERDVKTVDNYSSCEKPRLVINNAQKVLHFNDGTIEGVDGVSPTIEVTEIAGGHQVTITDANGTQSFIVRDGEGGSGASGHAPVIVTVSEMEGTASHSAVNIYALINAGYTVLAGRNGDPSFVYRYKTARVVGGACEWVEFYYTAVNEDGTAFTEFLRIFADYTAEISINEATSGGSGTGETDGKIPSYWETMVATKTETVKALQMAGGKDCVSFVWASDTHIPDSDTDTTAGMGRTLHIGKIMAKMLDNCEIPFAVISGDVATRESKATEAQYKEALKKLPVHLSPLWGTDRLLMALGNHDGCWGDSAGYYRHQLNPEKMWQTFFRGQALDFRRVFSDDGLYYYVDNVAQKTRFIILNSHFGGEYAEDGNGWAVNDRFHTYCYGQAQLDWLANVALDMPAGYGAVVITHIPPSIGKSVDTAQLTGIIKAYNDRTTFNGSYTSGVDGWSNSKVDANFANATGEVIAVFAGHTHGDAAGILDSTGCPQLTIMAAGATLNVTTQPDRVFGTDTETSLDVVTINRATKTIYCTRVGYGNDRVISYGNTEVKKYTVANNLTNCTNSNGASTATEGTSYSATITAKSGYVLNSVTVTMGGKNITSTAYSNGKIAISSVTGNIVITATAVVEAVTTYTVTNNLTNCSNSNSATSVNEGSAYNATITANSGYTLDSVSVTMGGNAVTVNNGVVNIASVTGNIIITATATEAQTEPDTPPATGYTNLAVPSATNASTASALGDTSIWVNDTRINSGWSYVYTAGDILTNYIPVTQTSKLHVKGLNLLSGTKKIYFFGDGKQKVEQFTLPGAKTEWLTTASYDSTVTIVDVASMMAYYSTTKDGQAVYCRICCNAPTEDVIITDGEEIT